MTELIDLTVIGSFRDGTTRAYLHYLRQAGLRPRRLWLIDFFPETPRRRWLRALLGRRLADRMRPPQHAPNARRGAFESLCARVQAEAGLPVLDYFADWEPHDFAQQVDRFCASGYDDPWLQRRLRHAATEGAFLYTSGGIVPRAALVLPGVRILHLHPGVVPEVRGSDCLLWSAATRGRFGVSCFYMSAGIDEGEVIRMREWPLPHLPSLIEALDRGAEHDAYDALIGAVDPHYRAQLLVDVMRQGTGRDLRSLSATPQAIAQRSAFLWMHPKLRAYVMRRSFS